ncbi:MAG: SGNH/GDSL hydrolase family protein [Desulfomonilaceae bacterium]
MANKSSASIKIILINLILIVILVVVSFYVLESILRSYVPDTDHTGMNELAPAPLYYRIKPNFKGVLEGVQVTINSNGYRDREFMRPMSQKEDLIAILGDSITFGQGVPQDETFPAILEKLLNESESGGKNFRVWNLGVPGYNTMQEYEVFKSLVLPAKPTWVFLAYVINDVEPVNEGALRLISGEKTERNKSWFSDQWDRSIVVHIAKNRLGGFIRWIKPDWRFSSYVDDAISQYDGPESPWIEVSRTIISMKKSCDENGIRFTLVMIPSMMDFDNYPFLRINQIVEDFCKANNIDFLDVLPYFKDSNPEQLFVSIIDPHPNELAQSIIARALMDHIREARK